jgi:hypothetical protein
MVKSGPQGRAEGSEGWPWGSFLAVCGITSCQTAGFLKMKIAHAGFEAGYR